MVRLANPVSGGTFWERCAHRSVPLLVVALYLACVKKVHCAVRLYAWINGECKGDVSATLTAASAASAARATATAPRLQEK